MMAEHAEAAGEVCVRFMFLVGGLHQQAKSAARSGQSRFLRRPISGRMCHVKYLRLLVSRMDEFMHHTG